MATSADLTDICRQIIHLALDDRLLSTIESHYDVDRTERLSERIGPAYRNQIRTDLLDGARALAALYAEEASDRCGPLTHRPIAQKHSGRLQDVSQRVCLSFPQLDGHLEKAYIP